MIKTLLMAMTCLTSAVVCAQNDDLFGFSKGDVTLSGGISISTSKYTDDQPDVFDNERSNTFFSVQPSIAYFLTDHFALGSQTTFGRSKNKQEDISENTSDFWRVGVFGRYYFSPKKSFTMFSNLGVNYISSVTEFMSQVDPDPIAPTDIKDTSRGFDFGLSVGVNYFVSSHFALNAGIGLISYTSLKFEDNQGNVTNQKGFQLDTRLQNIAFGLLYRI